MNRECKNATRMTPRPVAKAEDGGNRGPSTHDGRANLGAVPLGQVTTRAPLYNPKPLKSA